MADYTKYVPENYLPSALFTSAATPVVFKQSKYEQQLRQYILKDYEIMGRAYLNFMRNVLIPRKIIHNEKATIVFWKDGTKTVVKRMEGTKDDVYTAFTAALAKRLYGTNSSIKKILKDKVIER